MFRLHGLTKKVCDEDDAPVRLFSGATGLRVAQVRLSPCARRIGETPPLRLFVHENAYRCQGYVHIKPVSDDLPLPVEVEVRNIHIPFMSRVNRMVLTSATEPVNVPIPKHDYSCSRSDLVITLKKDGRELWRHETLVMNPVPVSAAMSRFYRGEAPYPPQEKPDWMVKADNTFEYKGKPHFPLMLEFARPDCLDEVIDIGFNMISLRRPKDVKVWEWKSRKEELYVRAAARGVTLTVYEDREGRPAQGFYFMLDEPFGYTFEGVRDMYMKARDGRAHATTIPIVATQNNEARYRETSMACDILAPDPYNKGRGPLRNIYDSIRSACEDVDHLKPVMSYIGNYGTDRYRPDAEELRTMCYLSIAAGATALAFYSWDEGDEPGGPTDTSRKPNQIAAYRRLFREFKVLDPALTTANVETPKVEPAQPRGFFPCVKKGRDGKIYLIVASDLYRSATRKIVIPSAAGCTAKLLFGPDRAGKLTATKTAKFDSDGAVSLSLPPVSSAVYVIAK